MKVGTQVKTESLVDGILFGTSDTKLRDTKQLSSENSMIPVSDVLSQYTHVEDRRQTDYIL